MSTETTTQPDFRAAVVAKKAPKVVADVVAGMVLGCAEVSASPEQVCRALMTTEVERWWTMLGVYRLKDWECDLRPQGRWSVTIALPDGRKFNEWGEICEVNAPHKVVMTRRFAANPLIGERETTLTYRFEPSARGTLVIVREEGFIGRPDAANGNAENWEKVLGWLDDYLNKEYEKAKTEWKGTVMSSDHDKTAKKHGYAPVDGLKMYYEIEGTGDPLVFIPPAFGAAGLQSFPTLVQNHSVITVDLQGNGRTADIPERPLSIEQNAQDVVGLLKYLGISKADFFGESYGGNAVFQLAIRHPDLVRRVAAYGATFAPPQIALNPETTRYGQPPTAESANIEFQRENYKRLAPDPDYWGRIYNKLASLQWHGFSKEELASIKVPALVIVGDHDFVRVEHAVEGFKAIPGAELAVIPSASHFVLYSEQERVIPIVKHFLEKPEEEIPLATAEVGYCPGKTR